jgi:hypothetical protein
MKEIPLTQGKVALVDDEDYEWLNQWKWCAYKNKNTFYAARHTKTENGKQTMIRMHIEVIGKREGLITDHINGNGLENRRENLRHVTRRQNGQNRHDERSSKHPGVSWYKRDKNWQATIQVNGKRKHLGYFSNEADAFRAYCSAVKSLGESMLPEYMKGVI